MLPFFSDQFGNAASTHLMGRAASRAVEMARTQIAEVLDCDPAEIIFTSGATESNNLAILGVAEAGLLRKSIATSTVEHKSVLAPCRHLASRGFTIKEISVTQSGVVDRSLARALIDDDTSLVTIQAANNETGVIQPMRELADLAHERGALVHCDAAQMLGKGRLGLRSIGADLLSLSAHKAYGPKGIGLLVIRGANARAAMAPVLYGGGQETGIRPGTLNVAGVVGFARACVLCRESCAADQRRMVRLRDDMERRLKDAISCCTINGATADRLPNTTSLTVPGIPADMLMANVPMLCLSNGSACNSGAPEPSHVLLAMGLSRDNAECTVRISLGRYTTDEDIKTACSGLASGTFRVRDIMKTDNKREGAQER